MSPVYPWTREACNLEPPIGIDKRTQEKPALSHQTSRRGEAHRHSVGSCNLCFISSASRQSYLPVTVAAAEPQAVADTAPQPGLRQAVRSEHSGRCRRALCLSAFYPLAKGDANSVVSAPSSSPRRSPSDCRWLKEVLSATVDGTSGN